MSSCNLRPERPSKKGTEGVEGEEDYGGEDVAMSQKFKLYPNIVCPYCRFHTSAPESLGVHLVDKHGDKVIRGVNKVRSVQKAKQAIEVTA